MAEWSKAAASKAVISCEWDRGFESPSLLQKRMYNDRVTSFLQVQDKA